MNPHDIIAARTSGTLLAEAAALGLTEGYAVAEQVWAGLGPLAGWKVGATSAGGQAMLGVDAPIVGRVPASGLHQPGTIALIGDRDAEAEPEILFRIGVEGAVDAVHLGVEIVRPSRDDAFQLGAGYIVADNAAHVALVNGPQIDAALLDQPESLAVSVQRNGEDCGGGTAAMVLGDPRRALAWLASVHRLQPGDWIASGAMARACRFARGDTVVADFGSAGRIEIRRA